MIDPTQRLAAAIVNIQRAKRDLVPNYASREFFMAVYSADRTWQRDPDETYFYLMLAGTILSFVEGPDEAIRAVHLNLRRARRALGDIRTGRVASWSTSRAVTS